MFGRCPSSDLLPAVISRVMSRRAQRRSAACIALGFSGRGLDGTHAAADLPPTRSRRTWLGVRWPWRPISHRSLYVRLNSRNASTSSATVAKRPHPQELLLEGADEPLGAAVPLRLPHEARRAGHAQEPQLPLEVVAEVVAAVVVADGQPLGRPSPRTRRSAPARPAAAAPGPRSGCRRLAACSPTHSQVQWSTATKTWAVPSPVVTVVVMSVPHIVSGSSVVIVPSWAFGPWALPPRRGAWR